MRTPEKKQKVCQCAKSKHTRTKEELHEGNGKPYVTDDGVHMKALLNFPRPEGAQHHLQRYILQRVVGDDILQVVREHDMEGYLELQSSSEHDNNNENTNVQSANFYLKFPYHQGMIAGRLDNVAPRSRSTNQSNIKSKTDGPCFFTAVCCKAYVNYGTWDGTIRRHLSSENIRSIAISTGLHFAEAGNEHISAENPFYIDKIHSMEVLKDQPDERDQYDVSQHYLFPEGYQPLTKGCFNFTLFLKRLDENEYDDENQKEEDPYTTLCLIFRPETKREEIRRATSGSTSVIPKEIVEEINKLPPSEHIRDQD